MASKPTLYHIKYFCSSRPLSVIHYLGIQDLIDVKTIERPDLQSADYLKVNPHATVPALVLEDGTVLLESAAISLWLVEKYGGKLHSLLGNSNNRAKLLQWLFYAPGTLYPLTCIGYAQSHLGIDKSDLSENAKTRWATSMKYIESQLPEGDTFILGPEITLADIYLSYELVGGLYLSWMDVTATPKVQKYLDKLQALDFFPKVYHD